MFLKSIFKNSSGTDTHTQNVQTVTIEETFFFNQAFYISNAQVVMQAKYLLQIEDYEYQQSYLL